VVAPIIAPQAAAPATEVPKYGGIAVFANRADPGTWDPMQAPGANGSNIFGSVYGNGNLVVPCPEDVFKVCPGLAESWESSSDFTQWTFKIRANVLWHDGAPFTAEDAKFWADLSVFGAEGGGKKRPPSRFGLNVGPLSKAEVLPGNRLRLTFKEPVPIYLEVVSLSENMLAHPKHLMQPRIQAGEVNVSPSDLAWVATGAFKLAKYEKGVAAQLRRFDRYWGKDKAGRQLPFLDGIDLAIIRDPSAMDAAFRVGRLDGGARGDGHYLSKERQAGYIRDLGDKVWFGQISATLHSVSLNVARPGPLQDVRLRKAMALWMDKDAGIPSVLGGFGQAYTLADPASPWPDPEFRKFPGFGPATKERDRAEAKRLMAEAGYATQGPTLNVMCRRLWIARCEFVHSQWTTLGINIQLDLLDDTGWIASRARLDHALRFETVCAVQHIPEGCPPGLARHSVSAQSVVKHEDPKVDEFFQRLSRAATFDQRLKVYRELERYVLLDQVYVIPAWGQLGVIPFRSYVKGLLVPAMNPQANTDLAAVWLDK
jgi:ABC-type transport system substrate-binding protein